MATLSFDGADDFVQSSTLGFNLTGAYSAIGVLRRSTTAGGFDSWISNNVAAGTPAIALEFNQSAGNKMLAEHNGSLVSTGTLVLVNDTTDWWFVSYTRAAGSNAGRFHMKNLTTLATTVHEAGGTAIANPNSQAGGSVTIGNYGTGLNDDYAGEIALVAEFDSDLGDSGIDTILAGLSTSTIYGLTPKLLVECTALTPVDLMGLSTFSAASGATLTGANPANWTLDGIGGPPPVPVIRPDYTQFPKYNLRRRDF